MSELTRYRYEPDKMRYKYADGMLVGDLMNDGVLVPDSTLQDIADAWTKTSNEMSGDQYSELAYDFPQFVALLDALEGTDDE